MTASSPDVEALTERGYGVGLEEQRLSLDLLRLQEHGARLVAPQHAEALLQNHIFNGDGSAVSDA